MVKSTTGIMQNTVSNLTAATRDVNVPKTATIRENTAQTRDREMGCVALIRSDAGAWARLWAPDETGPVSWGTVLRLIFNYAGLRATALYRIGHALWRKRIAVLPGMVQRTNITLHGFDVPSNVPIGPGLYVPHPVGTVITARQIGANVTLISAITIGMRSEPKFPTLGDGVFVGAGARILGDITVGDGAQVGANAVVLKDVPAGATAVGVPAIIKMKKETRLDEGGDSDMLTEGKAAR
jgi:serine O-acetyltransferase